MTPTVFDFDLPERFVAGTVGQPGERTFFLQASTDGRTVSVALEKVQVEVLSERLGELLDEVRRRGLGGTSDEAPVDVAPLDTPIREQFRVGDMALRWVDGHVVVEAAAQPAPDAPEPAARAEPVPLAGGGQHRVDTVSDEQVADGLAWAEAELAEVDADLADDLAAMEETGPVEPGSSAGDDLALSASAVLRVRVTPGQARAFLRRAAKVVGAGRRPCVLCGRPLDPHGHPCPGLN